MENTRQNGTEAGLASALEAFLRPIVGRVVTDCLTEAFAGMEPGRAKRYYTREEACERLRIGTTTFYRLASKGKITILKVGGKTVVDADELDGAVGRRELIRRKR